MSTSLRSDIVITGCGLHTPLGSSLEDACGRLWNKKTGLVPYQPFGAAHDALLGGVIPPGSLGVELAQRQLKKLDRFTALALASSRDALESACIHAPELKEEVGIIVGNSFGGWSFVEPMMYGLNKEGMSAINAYVATAWFPAAAQGEVSIRYGLKGYSKTLSAGRLSSALAVEHAARTLLGDRAKVMLAGGSEAPLSGLVVNAQTSSQAEISKNADGTPLLGEGAAFLVLERAVHAEQRAAPVLARLRAFERDGRLDEAVRAALDVAQLKPSEITTVILGAPVNNTMARRERDVLSRVLGSSFDSAEQLWPEPLTGDLVGAAAAASLVYACQVARTPGELEKNVLVNSIDATGGSMAFIVSSPTLERPRAVPRMTRNPSRQTRNTQ